MIPARRVSQIPEDIVVVAASFGPSPKQEYYRHFVRGVPVQWLNLSVDKYRWVIFPDGRVQLVNETNIRSVKINNHGVLNAPAREA